MSTTLVLPTPAAAPASNPLQFVVFYGASRFEAPQVGMKFRRNGTTYQILGVRGERTGSRDFSRTWKFMAECQTLPRDY